MNRRNFLAYSGMLSGSLVCAANLFAEGQEPAYRPNIVYILADDLGYGDLGCYGQEKIETPEIDALARQGMRFTNHYAGQTVCSPSRASLMTGLHMGHCPIRKNGDRNFNAEDITIAMLLKDAGYKTAMIGKWGMLGRPGHPSSPNNKGFDYWFGYDNQGFAHFYYPAYLWRNDQKVLYPENRNLRDAEGHYRQGAGRYSHDEFEEDALRFLREHADEPFFLYLPFTIPHAELTVPMDSKRPYLEKGWPETPKELGGGGAPGKMGYGSQYEAGYCAQRQPNATYAGMVSRLDRSVGRIVDLLDELGLTENTIVIFSSDNGPSDEGGQSLEFFKSRGALRGKKGSIYEAGTRVPLIVRWPVRIKAGTVCDKPCGLWDFMPTACELAGIRVPRPIDGVSLLPELFGRDAISPERPIYYWWIGKEAIRSGKWKLIRNLPGKGEQAYELYNLEDDPAEERNLAETHPEIVVRLLDIMQREKAPLGNDQKT